MAFVNERTEDGQWQTIDREKEAVLLYRGRSGGDEPYEFDFRFKGENMHLSAFSIVNKISNGQNVITWKIVKLFIPANLQKQHEEIKALLVDAFDSCGLLFSRKHVASVHVAFENSEM